VSSSESATDRLATTLPAVLLLLFAVSASFSIAASQTVMILIGLYWIVFKIVRRDNPGLRWSLIWPAVGFVALSLLSALLSVDRAFALDEWRGDLLPLVFFFACINLIGTCERATRLTRLLIISGAVSGLYGLTQLWTEGLAFRITGPMGHYMTLAGILLTALLLALSQLIFTRDKGWTLWLAVLSVTLFVALLMTQTRGAWLGLLAGLTVLAWFWDKRYLMVLPLVALLIVIAAPAGARQRMIDMLTLQDVTTIERVYMWGGGWQMIKDHPLTGVGPNVVRKVYQDYKLADDPWLERREFKHMHNNLVQLAAGRGIPALCCWLWFWAAVLWHARRADGRWGRAGPHSRALTAGGLACIAAFLVAGLFEYNYGDGEVIALLLFAVALLFRSSLSRPCHTEGSSSNSGSCGTLPLMVLSLKPQSMVCLRKLP
jgi:O-antigen ligase